MSKSKILFQLTGSIACYKSAWVISKLVKEGHSVQTVCTDSALQFIGRATLEGLTGKPVFIHVYEEGRMMDHIHLARWADLMIVCPATAHTINQMSQGLATDAVGNLFLAHDFKKPYIVAPAMNEKMFQHPATQASIRRLREWGVKVLETGVGDLACGEIGEGRLLEPDAIFEEIARSLKGI